MRHASENDQEIGSTKANAGIARTKTMGKRFHDYSGRRFGSWVIVNPIAAPNGNPGRSGAPAGYRGKWVVRCDCSRIFERHISSIVAGGSRSCIECFKRRNREQQHKEFLVGSARMAAKPKIERDQSESPVDRDARTPLLERSLALAPQDQMRYQLLTALRRWILAQRVPQRVISERLEIPRSSVSTILTLGSKYRVSQLLDLWVAVGGQWQLTLTTFQKPKPTRPMASESHQEDFELP
jgi:predicted XRE-type DNA-binding protein